MMRSLYYAIVFALVAFLFMLGVLGVASAATYHLRASMTVPDPALTALRLEMATPPIDPRVSGVEQTCCNTTATICAKELMTANLLFPCPGSLATRCADFTVTANPNEQRSFALCPLSGVCSNLLTLTLPASTPTPAATPSRTPSPLPTTTPTRVYTTITPFPATPTPTATPGVMPTLLGIQPIP
jgi:hypothetical protein